jgi:hypothetical protein
VFVEENQCIAAEVDSFLNICRTVGMLVAMSKGLGETILKNSYVSGGVKIS